MKTTKTKTTKTKPKVSKLPTIIQSDISLQKTPKVTIIVSNGIVQDILKEKCLNTEIVIHDYDVEGEDETHLLKDEHGKNFKVITF